MTPNHDDAIRLRIQTHYEFIKVTVTGNEWTFENSNRTLKATGRIVDTPRASRWRQVTMTFLTWYSNQLRAPGYYIGNWGRQCRPGPRKLSCLKHFWSAPAQHIQFEVPGATHTICYPKTTNESFFLCIVFCLDSAVQNLYWFRHTRLHHTLALQLVQSTPFLRCYKLCLTGLCKLTTSAICAAATDVHGSVFQFVQQSRMFTKMCFNLRCSNRCSRMCLKGLKTEGVRWVHVSLLREKSKNRNDGCATVAWIVLKTEGTRWVFVSLLREKSKNRNDTCATVTVGRSVHKHVIFK